MKIDRKDLWEFVIEWTGVEILGKMNPNYLVDDKGLGVFDCKKKEVLVFIFLLTLVSLGHFAFAQSEGEKKSSEAQKVFQAVKGSVFQIKTALNPSAPKASYGSGFVVAKEGLVATNYHVVASAIQEDKDYKLYLVDGEQVFEAKIFGIDVIHDIALLKVDRVFDHVLTLAAHMPSQGAKIFSIGIPLDLNMSITEGNYNGVLREAVYGRVHMASPLNSGMSGGPTVDKYGRVIGVNVSVLFFSQSVSFSVPVEFVKELIQKSRRSDGKSIDPHALHSEIESQLISIQESLITDLEKSEKKELEFGDWVVSKPSEILKCWSTNNDDAGGYFFGIIEGCQLNSAAFLSGGVSTGSYEISYQTFGTKKLSYWQLLNVVSKRFNSSSGMENILLSTFHLRDNILTRFSCAEERMLNSQKIPLLIRYCVRGYVRYPKIFNAEIKILTLNKSDKILLASATLTGFTLSNIKKFITRHVEGIGLVESRSH